MPGVPAAAHVTSAEYCATAFRPDAKATAADWASDAPCCAVHGVTEDWNDMFALIALEYQGEPGFVGVAAPSTLD